MFTEGVHAKPTRLDHALHSLRIQLAYCILVHKTISQLSFSLTFSYSLTYSFQ